MNIDNSQNQGNQEKIEIIQKTEYICYPQIGDFQELTKIVLSAWQIDRQATFTRATESIKRTGTSPLCKFKFIAPNEIVENVAHTWDDYDSITTKIMSLAGSAEKVGQEWKNLKEIFSGIVSGLDEKEWITAFNNVKDSFKSGSVAWTRLDMPLVYTNSERRKYDFTFPLSVYDNPVRELLEPIRALQVLSCANLPKGETFSQIYPPAIFSIRTESGFLDKQNENDDYKLLDINNAALISIQPTFKGPYRGQLPMNCDLMLSFEEIDPLWAKSFKSKGIVRAGETRTTK